MYELVSVISRIVPSHAVDAGGVNVVAVGDPPPRSTPSGLPDASKLSNVITYVGGVPVLAPYLNRTFVIASVDSAKNAQPSTNVDPLSVVFPTVDSATGPDVVPNCEVNAVM